MWNEINGPDSWTYSARIHAKAIGSGEGSEDEMTRWRLKVSSIRVYVIFLCAFYTSTMGCFSTSRSKV